MITFEQLTKRYGDTIAVDDLTVSVAPGQVTGLLGPDGAGKSTTLRLLLGLDHPTAGTARIAGRPYAALRAPLRTVGAHLDTRSVHPGRTARRHLLALARANRLPARRVDEVIAQVGLHAVAHRRAGTFSQGMAQRLGIAAALLGDPSVLVLDEPTNGLDTDGIRWIRTLLTGFAAEGRTVLLSSHLLAELHQTADHVIVLGRGRLLADCAVAELVATTTTAVHVRMPDLAQRTAFAHLLEADGSRRPERRRRLRTSPVLVSAARDRGGAAATALRGAPPREDVGRDEAAWQVEFHGRTDDGTPWPSTERRRRCWVARRRGRGGRDAWPHCDGPLKWTTWSPSATRIAGLLRWRTACSD